jgi:hypothetical protein
MRLAVCVLLASAVWLAPQPAAALKKIPYPEVKVEAPPPFPPDRALDALRKSLADAVRAKDAKALFSLVGPDFAWTADGEPAEQSDPSRDALHNFKLAFGFREPGAKEDGNSADALWILLEDAVSDPSLTPREGEPAVACGPVSAQVIDEDARERATDMLASEDEGVEWVYALKEIALTETPTGGGTVARVSKVALPVVSKYPPAKRGESLPASFYEVLLPFGRTGWIDADGVDPLAIDRLCYGRDKSGAWKIVGYEQNS